MYNFAKILRNQTRWLYHRGILSLQMLSYGLYADTDSAVHIIYLFYKTFVPNTKIHFRVN